MFLGLFLKNMSIQEVLKEITYWVDIEGVEAIGEGENCIIVFISAENEEIRKKIPTEYKGYPVKIEVSGIISTQ